jgi:predicted nucleic acid-binding protein
MSELLLLDTNIVIYYLQEDLKLAGFLEGKRVAVSFISEIELLGWPNLNSRDKATINRFIGNSLLIDYSSRLKKTVIEIKQEYNLKLGDSFVAATAINYGIPLISADNVFKKIKELNFFLYKTK